MLLVGGYRVIDGSLELGVLTAFLLYLRQFYDPMEDVAIFYNSLQSATAALEKIAAVLAEEPAVPEPAKPTALSPTAARMRSTSTGSRSATDRTVECCPSSTCTSPPGRRWRWSARPAPASRRSPS